MNVVVPIKDFAREDEAREGAGPSLGSAREIWADRRRLIERRERYYGPDGSLPRWWVELFDLGVHGLAEAARFLRVDGRGRSNALAPRLEELGLSFSSLPTAFDGYRILQLSDTHLDHLPELSDIAGRMLDGIEVDLVVVTGDIHGHRRAALVESAAPLESALAGVRTRDGRLAVLGNHDPTEMAETLERLGFRVLLNESITLERHNQRLVVTGLDDVHRFYTPAATRTLADAPQGFRVALVHSPEMADHAAAAGYALYLCGHTHGGQICLPSGRPIFSRLRRCKFAVAGEWRSGSMIGYTNRGLGVSGAAMRFNCDAEMAVITLRRT